MTERRRSVTDNPGANAEPEARDRATTTTTTAAQRLDTPRIKAYIRIKARRTGNSVGLKRVWQYNTIST